MKIPIYRKAHYGNVYTYVKGELAHHIQELTDRITITNRDMLALKALGHEFEEVFEDD